MTTISRYKELLEMHQELHSESLAIKKLVAGGDASGVSSSFFRKIEGFKRKGYPITIGLVKEVSKKTPLFSEKNDFSGLRQQYELEKTLLRAEIVARRSKKKSRPPLLTAVKKTNLISVERGWREAPADILLAIAEGLATGWHWWLMNPNRQQAEREVSDPKSLDQVRDAYLECWLNEEGEWDQWATKIQFSQTPFKTGRFPGWLDPKKTPQAGLCRMRWTPIRNYRSGYNYERSIQIEVLPEASGGVIRWNTGTGEPSSFIGCILVILPGAEDDGRIAKNITEDDELVARYAKTVFEAKKAGYKRIKLIDPQWREEPPLYREDEYFLHLGYRERRSWTIQGEEKRIARWPRRKKLLQMIEVAKPLEYEVIK